mgnify:CR=1 FL=1
MERTQKEIDWTRAAQLAALRDAELSVLSIVVNDRVLKVKAVNAKAVLRQIDDYAREHGECYASQETLAAKTGLSEGTVKRVVKALVERSLITCELKMSPAGKVTNHHRIIWNELALLAHGEVRKPEVACVANCTPTDSAPEQSDSARGATDSALVRYKAPLTAMKRKPPPTSSLFPDPPPPPLAPDPEWQEAEEALAAQGVEDWSRPIEEVRRRGVSLEKVLLVIGYFARHKAEHQWGPGVLHVRLKNLTRDSVVDAGWPGQAKIELTKPRTNWGDPTKASVGIVKSYSARGDAEAPGAIAQQWQAAKAQQSQDQLELAKLEAAFGPLLDALAAAELAALVARAFSEHDPRRRMFVKRGAREAGLVREGLLERLKAETQAGEEVE